MSKETFRIRFIRTSPIQSTLDDPVKALANILAKSQFNDNLAVFYELGCQFLEIFTLDEISQAVDIAATKQGRSTLIDEWKFLRLLINEAKKRGKPYPSLVNYSTSNENNYL